MLEELNYQDWEVTLDGHTYRIRADMMGAISRYVEDGIPPGDFLVAVISNDLSEAVWRADEDNLANLPAFVAYFYDEAPSACWGSRDKLLRWLADKREAVR